MNINYKQIVDIIKQQLLSIIDNDIYYHEIKLVVTTERQFLKLHQENKINVKYIYAVVQFQRATLNYGVSVLPLTINFLSENNKIEICQTLLLTYAQTYNLVRVADDTILQSYTTPTIVDAFGEVGSGFRAYMSLSGTFVLSGLTNGIKEVYYIDEDTSIDPIKINFITYQHSYQAQLDPQVFFNSENMTRSVVKCGTFTFAVSAYNLDDVFYNKILDINGFFNDDVSQRNVSVNKTFNLKLVMKNGKTKNGIFKLVSNTLSNDIGTLPTIALVFSE